MELKIPPYVYLNSHYQLPEAGIWSLTPMHKLKIKARGVLRGQNMGDYSLLLL